MSQISIFTHNARRAGYAIKHWHLSNGSECMFAFNLNHKDPVKRRVYNDLKFRQALSYAVNRRRINETLYFGQGASGCRFRPSPCGWCCDRSIRGKEMNLESVIGENTEVLGLL
jgi:ABC-type transport system substrate-binding protein